jgi:hypothetical protein
MAWLKSAYRNCYGSERITGEAEVIGSSAGLKQQAIFEDTVGARAVQIYIDNETS